MKSFNEWSEDKNQLENMAKRFAGNFGGKSQDNFMTHNGVLPIVFNSNVLGGSSAVYFRMGYDGVVADAIHFPPELVNGAYVAKDFSNARNWVAGVVQAGKIARFNGKYRQEMTMGELEDHLSRYL